MSTDGSAQLDPLIQNALDELRRMILQHYPEATFQVSRAEDDPEIIHLTATVDVEDTDEVVDVVVGRMLALQVDEGVPVYVIPVRPMERVRAIRQMALVDQPKT